MNLVKSIGLARLRPLVIASVFVLLLVAGAFAATIVPFSDEGHTGVRPTGDIITTGEAVDTAGSGLPDAVENRIGSDPSRYDTLGGGVADGWLYHWYAEAVPWNDTTFLDMPVLVPPQSALPEPLQREGAIRFPTVQELFAFENETRGDGFWWLTDPALDPTQWDNGGDGIADAWLFQYGLDPLSLEPGAPSPGDNRMSLREKYEAGLDPTTQDTSGNGLSDVAALGGVAVFDGVERTFEPTDPRVFSTRGDGIPDGYLVRFGLNPHDDIIAEQHPAGDGLSVQEAYQASLAHCEQTEIECTVSSMVREGLVVDPTTWDTIGDGIADAWALADPRGLAHPLVDGTTVVVFDTQEWDANPWDEDPENLFGVMVDDQNPLPEEPHELTLFDLYTYQRPSEWVEEVDGPWWNGIPTDLETPEGALPPAVALRGWNIQIDTCRGCNESRPPQPEHLVTVHAQADPRKPDTSGDGLTDVEEYFGVLQETGFGFGRTNPSNPDTDGDGLTDHAEVTHWGTDPLRRDSSGSFLTDGEEVEYWSNRYDEVLHLLEHDVERAQSEYGWLVGDPDDLDEDAAWRLHPLGSVLDGTPNILVEDADGDGIPDGAELFPNRPWLGRPSGQERPPTDPARVDSDGDGLPDPWEIHWSQDRYHNCRSPCNPPSLPGHDVIVSGWPLDPSRWNSFVLDDIDESDADLNLAGDTVRAGGVQVASFSNRLAYAFGLHPFQADTSGDGLTDMFTLHWGVVGIEGQGVPTHAENRLDELVQESGFDWLEEQAGGLPGATMAVLDPTRGDGEVQPMDDLLGRFFEREKGTWVAKVPPIGTTDMDDWKETAGIRCDLQGTLQNPVPLPVGGPRSEAGLDFLEDRLGLSAGQKVPPRAGLLDGEGEPVDPEAACWKWVSYPLLKDAEHGTNPWLHDTTGDRLPDAWAFFYNETEGLEADGLSPGSVASGCRDESMAIGLPDPEDLPQIPGLGPRHGGQHPYCLTNLESYVLGLNPLKGDTDGGGLSDWIEVALGLDPLDPLDDRGEEDWSGDGLPNAVKDALGLNRFSPDTDRDGLLDGDWNVDDLTRDLWDDVTQGQGPLFVEPGQGGGNLCLRPGPDNVTGMENRPSFLDANDPGGNLTHTQRYDWFVSLGILHDTSPGNACPDPAIHAGESYPYALFKREVMRDVWSREDAQILGSGWGGLGFADPLRWDTSANRIPDGWFAYWRDRAGLEPPLCGQPDDQVTNALDPTIPDAHSNNPTGTIRNIVKYESGRPTEWNEEHDGPWWGGKDPTCRDTDGTADWFVSSFSAQDARDRDWDATGVPAGVAPFPGLGFLGEDHAIVARDPQTGIYQTNYTRLWNFLEARSQGFAFDRDDDGVPDFLDRARIQIDEIEIQDSDQEGLDGLTKDVVETFTVTGRVNVAESPLADEEDYEGPPLPNDSADDANGVANVTVKVVLSDSSDPDEASEAVLGFNLTRPDGTFEITGTTADLFSIGPAPSDFTVAGHLFRTGEKTQIPTGLPALNPGPVWLRVVAEPNDPTLQSVTFRNETGVDHELAVAYKDVGPGDDRFRIPQDHPGSSGPEIRAALLREDSKGNLTANTTAHHVRHATDAVFFGTSDLLSLDLRAVATLSLSIPADRLLVGEPVPVAGTLTDEQGVALPGRWVELFFMDDDGGTVDSRQVEVADDGGFGWSFPTHELGLEPGPYTIEATAILGENDDFLEAPPDQSQTVVLSRDTLWDELRFNDDNILPGDQIRIPPGAGLKLETRLLEVLTGAPVTDNEVELRIVSTGDNRERLRTTLNTDNDGGFSFSLPGDELPSDLPLAFLRIEINAQTITAQDRAAEARFFVAPTFETRVEVEDARERLGQSAQLRGQVVRTDDGSVGAGPGVIHVTGPGVDTEIDVIGDTGGRFTVPVTSDDPGTNAYTMRFVSTNDFLADSHPTTGNATHFSATQLSTGTPEALRDRPVEASGSLLLPDGRPAPGVVDVRWVDQGGQSEQSDPGQQDDGDLDDETQGWERTRVDRSGTWSAVLPPRPHAGHHEFEVRFNGTETLEPSQATGEAVVRTATHLELTSEALQGGPDGTTGQAVAVLKNQDGERLAGRALVGQLIGPNETVERLEGTTDSQGTMRLRLGAFELPVAGDWTWSMEYPGGALEAGAENTTATVVYLDRTLTIDRLSTRAEPGRELLVQGRIEALPRDHGATELQVLLGGIPVGHTTAVPDEPWQVSVTIPLDAHSGEFPVRITGTAGDFVQVAPAHASVTITGSALVEIEVVEHDDGSRDVNVQLTRSTDRIGPVEVTLVRRGDDGRLLGVHRVTTDSAGAAALHLAPSQQGAITAVHLDDPELRLEETTLIQSIAPTAGSTASNALLIIAITISTLLCFLFAAYVVWVRRQRQRVHKMFEDARTALMDPDADVRTIVMRTYGQILRLLEDAGYGLTEQHTVRDIMADLKQAFWLPSSPMAAASGLFEHAVYSDHSMSEEHRKTALDAFFTLSRAIRQEAAK